MPVRSIRTLLLLAVATPFAVVSLWAQAPKRDWKDRAEYDLYEAATKAADHNKRLELLNAWNEKYPSSDFRMERLVLFLNTYNAMGNAEQVMRTGNEILAIDSRNITPLYFMTLNTVRLAKPAPELLSMAEKAARSLVANYDSLRPSATPEADWNKERPNIMALGHLSLGWIAMQRKDNVAAEKEFTQSLKYNPNNGQVSYWLGSAILAQRNPDTQDTALFHIARAASYTGEGAYPDAGRKQASDYLIKAYTNYHGSADGLDAVRKLAAAQAFPPADFTIKSSQQLEIEKEEQFRRENPMLALWHTVKTELTKQTGAAAYFENNVKGALLPGGVNNVKRFRATLVAAKPAKNPKELVLSLENPAGDITLTLVEEALTGSAPAGTVLEFEGVPTGFTASPFMLIFEVDHDQLSGWPTPPAAKKKAAPAKK